MEKPTIAELESILNSESGPVEMLPDGSITAGAKIGCGFCGQNPCSCPTGQPFRCFSCRRKSWTERDHIGHRCNPARAWVTRKWRQIKVVFGLYEHGPGPMSPPVKNRIPMDSNHGK